MGEVTVSLQKTEDGDWWKNLVDVVQFQTGEILI